MNPDKHPGHVQQGEGYENQGDDNPAYDFVSVRTECITPEVLHVSSSLLQLHEELQENSSAFPGIVHREAYLVFRKGKDSYSSDANDERRFTDLALLDGPF
jgi:hypothetical protein